MDIIVSPFDLAYEGKDADEHILSAQLLGESIVGASKLYTAAAHYCIYGIVPRGNYKKYFRCYAKPPKDGSFEYAILLAAVANEWGMHGDYYRQAMSFIFPRVVDAIKNILVRKRDAVKVTEILANTLLEQARIDSAVQTQLINGLVKANDNLASLHAKMIDALPGIAEHMRGNAQQFVLPIGVTCNSIAQFKGQLLVSSIGESEAEAIRDDTVEVEEMQDFNCRKITEVNIQTGHCIIELEDFDGPISGKITDPVLNNPNNIYTRSLNNKTPFRVSAKPVKRDGVITKLFISDAKDA